MRTFLKIVLSSSVEYKARTENGLFLGPPPCSRCATHTLRRRGHLSSLFSKSHGWKHGSGFGQVSQESILLMTTEDVFPLHRASGLRLYPPAFVHWTRPDRSVLMALVFLLLSPKFIYLDLMSLSSSNMFPFNQFTYKCFSNLVGLYMLMLESLGEL